MKFCPTCQAKYDDEILRFCTKDGTPLVDENQPNFKELPSESIEADEADLGEETIVSYKPSKNILPDEPVAQPDPEIERSEAPRIVISTSEQERQQQNVRARHQIPAYEPLVPPQQSTGKVVVLTILGTLAVIALALGLFVMLRDEEPANVNFNVNTNPPDMNINNNLNFGASNVNLSNSNTNYNFNTNYNGGFNTNYNFNANTRTPTPTRTPSPTPTPAETNTNTGNVTNNAPPLTPRPTATATATPSSTPRTSPTPARTPPAGRPPGNSSEQP